MRSERQPGRAAMPAMPGATQPIKIAILAMGGEGGAVLADWIIDLAEHNGYLAQGTSVPGVAQRTGATIYYLELYPQAQAQADGALPVLALMPLPGDVDIVLASELMEAGRALQRGLVSAERSTLIASTHRVYSIAEKSAPGDGRVDSAQLRALAAGAALRFIGFDMAQLAQRAGSVISAALFGALAGSGALPFARAQFEATIARGGVGVAPSLQAFDAAHACAQSGAVAPADPAAPAAAAAAPAPAPRDRAVRALLARVQADFPAAAQALLRVALRRLIDYQDPDYAGLYLTRMHAVYALPAAAADARLGQECARQLALWMCSEDSARVAALKTRATRFARVRAEAGAQPGQLLYIHEYLHPRVQEICDSLPAALGRWLLASGAPRRLLERLTRRGRVLHSNSLSGYLVLRAVAWSARWRRSTLRYQEQNRRIEAWLQSVADSAAHNPQLALELAHCPQLIKGYGETQERCLRNYDAVMAAVQRAGAVLAPATLRAWRQTALADEHGTALAAALAATENQNHNQGS